MDKFNVFNIYELVFGYKAVPFPRVDFAGSIPKADKFSILGVSLYEKDQYGNEGFCPVKIKYQEETFNLPYSTISIQNKKKIKETSLTGRKGTVKELIQIGNYVFNIQGVAIIKEDSMPENEIINLRNLYEINDSVQLENAFSEIFLMEDNNVVIKNIDLPDMKGIIGAQAYSMTLLSDSVLTLEFNE